MDDKLSEKLGFVLKSRIINELNLEKKWFNKTKNELIEFCIKNNLMTPEKINELYNQYKDSSNAVLYLLLSTKSKFDYSKIDDKSINFYANMVNQTLKDDRIFNFCLESLEKKADYIHISLVFSKKSTIIYGGIPPIDGYKSGDVITISELEDVHIYHYNDYEKFIVKCNDATVLKLVKKIISGVFTCSVYHPKFDKKFIDKITENPNGKSHIIRASFLNQTKKSSEPSSITLGDEKLDEISLFDNLQNNSKYEKIYNCFRVEIFGKPRFVGISNTKGKLWIPATLEKREMEWFARAILQKFANTLDNLSDDPDKYILFHKGYIFDEDTTVNNLYYSISNSLITNEAISFDDNFFYNIVRHAKGHFIVSISPYYCEAHDITTQVCCINNHNHSLRIVVDQKDKKLFLKCLTCDLKVELIEYISNLKTTCCNNYFEVNSYSDVLCVSPTRKAMESIKDFFKNISFENFDTDFFCIYQGLISKYENKREWEYKTLEYFKPLSRIMSTSKNELLHSKLKIIKERCLVRNPKQEFCSECTNKVLGKSLSEWNIDAKNIHKYNKYRICLPRLIGYVMSNNFDGIHNGYEMADVKFIYDENMGLIKEFSNKNEGIKVGIHIKSAEKTDPKDCINPKITSAIGHIITSAFKKDFDIVGFAMPNQLNEEIVKELQFICQGLNIDLLIIDEDDWLKIYSYYDEQKKFDDKII